MRYFGAEETPVRRWAATFKNVAQRLLVLLLDPGPRRRLWKELESYLKHEARDPNVKRAHNIAELVA